MKSRLTDKNWLLIIQVKQNKKKWSQLDQIKENKNSSEASFKPIWHEIKTWSYLELLSPTKCVKCSS